MHRAELASSVAATHLPKVGELRAQVDGNVPNLARGHAHELPCGCRIW
jgi:hypothetical protein